MRDWKVRALVAALIGLAVPLIELALACRAPTSEACVWGKALISVSLALSVVVLGPVAFAVLSLIWKRAGGGKGPANPE